MTQSKPGAAPDLILLRDVGIDGADRRVLVWRLELRCPQREPVIAIVRSGRNGAPIYDLQQLGAEWTAVELSPATVETIAIRLVEEVTRAKLGGVLRAAQAPERGKRAA
jgi:hypothetical protein